MRNVEHRRIFNRAPEHLIGRLAVHTLDGLGAASVLAATLFAIASQMLPALTIFIISGAFFGFATLFRDRREVGDLLQSMSGPMRARPLNAFPSPKGREAKTIMDAVADWSEAQTEELSFLRSRAERDYVTMLPNRWHFKRLVEASIGKTPVGQSAGALFFLDLDEFKAVNDSLGHDAGDQTLTFIAQRIRLAIERGDDQSTNMIVGRLGSDEFTIFAPGMTTEADAMRLAERLQRVLSEPIEINAGTVRTSCCIGIAIASPGEGFASLLTSADTAMYAAKVAGKNQTRIFSAEMAREMQVDKLIESDIRAALSDGSLSIAYQPQFDCSTREIVSAEALLRWNHPVLGQIMPSRFVPVAERVGLIGLFGDWVLEEVVKCIARLHAQGTPLTLAINVSPVQLKQGGYSRKVKAALRRYNVPAHLLELEITESAAMTDCWESVRSLTELRNAGVTIAIDDFGVGYSNLARLVRLPIDRVKIDKSLIDNLVDHIETQLLVKTIIDMSNGLGVEVLAEGIEAQSQLDLLVSFGCCYGQGFLVSRPISSDALAKSLVSATHSTRSDDPVPEVAVIGAR